MLAQLRDELIGRTYQPLPARRQEIPKDGGKVRVLSISAIRDRVVVVVGRDPRATPARQPSTLPISCYFI